MYIQITTRCNMECEHCCYSCTSEGEDMTLETFEKCLEWGDEYPALGGGEPTIHPQFEKFLLLAIGSCEQVWLATNGKETKRALLLAKLARAGVISCELSQDEWHERIDGEVIEAFRKETRRGEYLSNQNNGDCRGYRDISREGEKKPINSGRCDWGDDGCPCEGMFIKPNGDIHQCGCEESPKLGNINDESFDYSWEFECYKNAEEK